MLPFEADQFKLRFADNSMLRMWEEEKKRAFVYSSQGQQRVNAYQSTLLEIFEVETK